MNSYNGGEVHDNMVKMTGGGGGGGGGDIKIRTH